MRGVRARRAEETFRQKVQCLTSCGGGFCEGGGSVEGKLRPEEEDKGAGLSRSPVSLSVLFGGLLRGLCLRCVFMVCVFLCCRRFYPV